MKKWIACGCLPGLIFIIFLTVLIAIVVPSQSEKIRSLSRLPKTQAFGQGGQPGVVCSTSGQGVAGKVAGFQGEQLQNAAAIVTAGKQMGLPQRAWVIAVATAMQESTLRVLNHGDKAGPDSRGLFQQRNPWGSLEERMDPVRSAKLFYKRLIALPRWESLPLTVAAQKVQISAFPEAYAKWEPAANQVVGAVQGIQCEQTRYTAADLEKGKTVVRAAVSKLGVDYAWGGGNSKGPTLGKWRVGAPNAHGDFAKIGFDCSGLALYAYAQIGITLPHYTQWMWHSFKPAITDREALLPGDLLMLGSGRSPSRIHHVGIYMGSNTVVEAPQSGLKVRIVPNIWRPGSIYATEFVGALRPWSLGRSTAV
ncbi:NlpC/P60 family protein [Embleya sp. NPDC001921]